MQITVVRIWLLSPYPRTHKEPCLGGCQSSRTPSNDDEVVVIGLREILGAIHFHWILKSVFLRSLKKKNNGRENNLTQKQQCLKSCERTLWRKTEGTSKGETQFVTSQHTMGNVHPSLKWWSVTCLVVGLSSCPLHVADSYCNGSAEYTKLRSWWPKRINLHLSSVWSAFS